MRASERKRENALNERGKTLSLSICNQEIVQTNLELKNQKKGQIFTHIHSHHKTGKQSTNPWSQFKLGKEKKTVLCKIAPFICRVGVGKSTKLNAATINVSLFGTNKILRAILTIEMLNQQCSTELNCVSSSQKKKEWKKENKNL